jgi:hypothetical protein
MNREHAHTPGQHTPHKGLRALLNFVERHAAKQTRFVVSKQSPKLRQAGSNGICARSIAGKLHAVVQQRAAREQSLIADSTAIQG